METIMRRNNSISVVKKHAIPYAHLHKKTYFNALEKILISPKNLKKTANYSGVQPTQNLDMIEPGVENPTTQSMMNPSN